MKWKLHVVLFIMLYRVVLTFKSWMKPWCDPEIKAIEQYFHVCYTVQGGCKFEIVNKTLVCNNLNESYGVVSLKWF